MRSMPVIRAGYTRQIIIPIDMNNNHLTPGYALNYAKKCQKVTNCRIVWHWFISVAQIGDFLFCFCFVPFFVRWNSTSYTEHSRFMRCMWAACMSISYDCQGGRCKKNYVNKSTCVGNNEPSSLMWLATKKLKDPCDQSYVNSTVTT